MLSLLLGLWTNPIARIMIAIALGLAAWKANNWNQQRLGENKIIEKSERDGERKDAQATQARDAVNSDDATFRKLLQQYCRDCKR